MNTKDLIFYFLVAWLILSSFIIHGQLEHINAYEAAYNRCITAFNIEQWNH